jgi:hypothetical protein
MLVPRQTHVHQCPKCGVVYDCNEAGCVKFQKGCYACRFSLI